MKTRILAAVVALPLLFVLLFFLPAWATATLISALSAVAVWELLYFTGVLKHLRILIYATVFSAAVPWYAYFELGYTTLLGGIFLLLLLVSAEAIFTFSSSDRLGFTQIAGVFFAAFVIPLLLSSLLRLKQLPQGQCYVLLPFVIAFVSDGGAYFTGVFLGKHKLAPHVSPKKTVEGAIGGVVSSVVITLLYGVLLQLAADFVVNYALLILYGFVGSVISQLGDLSFSLLKRGFGVKDFGRLIPGHGGVLDRFDSVIFTAPATELLLALVPAFYWI